MACAHGRTTMPRRTPISTGSSARSAASSPTSLRRRRPTSRRRGSATRSRGSSSAGRSAASAATIGHTILRVLPMAVADFVAESFETDALQAAIAWRGVRHSFARTVVGRHRPRSSSAMRPATTVARPARRCSPIGGPGALSEALASAARAAGAEIRCDAEVVAITVARRPRHRRRPRLRRGARRPGRGRPGVDPKRTLIELADPVTIGPSMLLAGRQLPDAGRRRQGQPRASTGCPGSRAAAGRRRAAPPRPDRRRARDRRDRARVRRREVRARLRDAGPRGDDPVARRSVARRRSAGRDARRQRQRPVRAVPASGRLVGRPRAGRCLRRSGRRRARCARARVRLEHPRPRGHHAARPRARLRPDRRPPAAWRAGAGPVLPVAAVPRQRAATACRSPVCTCVPAAPTRAAASPASPARTRPARSCRT